MNPKTFSPGFRFSGLDAVVLSLGLAGVLLAPGVLSLHDPVEELMLAIGMPVLAFFAFCNVFRVSRTLELCWAAAFVGLCVAAFRYRALSLTSVVVVAAASMAVVIAVEMCRPSYHGVGWKFINPHLPEWWQERAGSAADDRNQC